MDPKPFTALIFVILISTLPPSVTPTSFTFSNKCPYTVWPGILASSGSPPLASTGFELPPSATRTFPAPPGWSGRFWARTGCSLNPTTNAFSCLTADCGSNQIECNGSGATPPATLAEFTLTGTGGAAQDFYDVSLVDGYNLPLIVEATTGAAGGGACGSTGCVADLNERCPEELRAEGGGACKSACEAFGTDEYCCSGAYATPEACKPTVYSEVFKSACPRSYSYAYDDATSTFTCPGGADYTVTFCPTGVSQKSTTTGSSIEGGSGGAGSTSVSGTGSGSSSAATAVLADGSWLGGTPNTGGSTTSSRALSSSSSYAVVVLLLLSLLLSFIIH